MDELYAQLVDATIAQLNELKARGVKYVQISPEGREIGRCAQPSARTTPSSKPTVQKPIQIAVADSEQAALEPARPDPSPNTVTLQPSMPVPNITQNIQGQVATPTPITSPIPPSTMAALNPQNQAEAFAELRSRALVCQKCPHLARSRKTVVFGVGDITSPLMFVGEAPGADEDEKGEPFVGKAGQLLTRIIQAMGFTRDTVFIANVLKCRPDTPGQTAGNRKPTPEEMQTCLPYLQAQIDLIKPRVIVALGATAVEGLLGKTVGITKLRGHFQQFRGTPLMPTYHPAYLLRNQSVAIKREVWEDMLQVLEKLERPISDKMRNYFKS